MRIFIGEKENPSSLSIQREGLEMGGEAWWWAAASTAQLAVGIASYKRGCGESGFGMPFKAFAIATLFIGAGATAVAGTLHATGISTVDDIKGVGVGIRRWIKARPREN